MLIKNMQLITLIKNIKSFNFKVYLFIASLGKKYKNNFEKYKCNL